jgi:DNA-binding SARP family transcriptional activator/predicted ATPase
MEDVYHLRLLGPVQIEQAGTSVHGFESRKALALLCYLVVRDQGVPRSQLADLFWGDKSEVAGRANLSRVLHNLATLLPNCLRADRDIVQFRRSAAFWLDVDTFEQLITLAETDSLVAAVRLYRNEFMAGFYLDDCPEFEMWLVAERERWHQRVVQVLQQLITHYTHRGDYEKGIAAAQRLLELEPWHEEAHRQLMLLLVRTGQRSAALVQFETCRKILAEELGVEPEAETIRLYERVREGRVSRDDTRLMPPAFLSFAPPPPPPSAPFVAREQELAQLEMFLNHALQGKGRVVFVTGEAGSGKTTLVEKFVRRAQATQPELIVVSGICNAFTGLGDPYLPFREILALLSGDLEHRWTAGVLSREQVTHLWQLMPLTIEALVNRGPDLVNTFVSGSALAARATEAVLEEPAWLKGLKELLAQKSPFQGPLNMPQSDLFEQYTQVLKRLAQQHPLLLVVDDLQWADIGSIGLLFHLGRQVNGSRILVVGMYRPADVASAREGERHPLLPVVNEFKRAFGETHLHLGQTEGRMFVDALLDTEPNRLDEHFRLALYRQTRGHALFTVEMLRTMQERGELVKDDMGHWIEGSRVDWETLPARVEGVIGERLGRLSLRLQEALKVASVEGEAFTAEVVAQVQAVDARDLVRQLSGEVDKRHRLVKEQGLLRLNSQRLSQYMFRHNLFQKYLYNSLGEVERAHLHEAVGNSLETLYGDHQEEIAVQLAWHFQEGGIVEKAIDYLLLAGKQAIQFSANAEAIAHLTQGLTLLKTQPVTSERIQQELNFHLALGVAVTATKGYGSPEAEKIYVRARELGQQVGKISQLFPALYGLWRCYLLQGQLQKARESAEQLLQLAQTTQEHALLLEAHRALGAALFHLGELVSTQRHLEQGIILYDAQQHRSHAFLYGHDPGVTCLNYAALNLWLLGYPDQSLARSREILRLVQEELSHPFSLAYTLTLGSWLHVFRREIQVTRERAEAAISLSTERSFPLWLALGLALRGWALVEQGQGEAGIAQLRQGLEAWGTTGAEMFRPQILALLTEAYGKVGQTEEALTTLAEALAITKKTGESWWNAELYRLKGEMLLRSKTRAEDEIKQCFWQAIEIARQQSAKSLELRAVMSLSRLWQHQEKQEETYPMLAEIYNWFSEGFDTPDLQEAKLLLEESLL